MNGGHEEPAGRRKSNTCPPLALSLRTTDALLIKSFDYVSLIHRLHPKRRTKRVSKQNQKVGTQMILINK